MNKNKKDTLEECEEYTKFFMKKIREANNNYLLGWRDLTIAVIDAAEIKPNGRDEKALIDANYTKELIENELRKRGLISDSNGI